MPEQAYPVAHKPTIVAPRFHPLPGHPDPAGGIPSKKMVSSVGGRAEERTPLGANQGFG
jgi:hypothetical protein